MGRLNETVEDIEHNAIELADKLESPIQNYLKEYSVMTMVVALGVVLYRILDTTQKGEYDQIK